MDINKQEPEYIQFHLNGARVTLFSLSQIAELLDMHGAVMVTGAARPMVAMTAEQWTDHMAEFEPEGWTRPSKDPAPRLAFEIERHWRPSGVSLFRWDGKILFPKIGTSGVPECRFVAFLVMRCEDAPTCVLRTGAGFPVEHAEKYECGCVVSPIMVAPEMDATAIGSVVDRALDALATPKDHREATSEWLRMTRELETANRFIADLKAAQAADKARIREFDDKLAREQQRSAY